MIRKDFWQSNKLRRVKVHWMLKCVTLSTSPKGVIKMKRYVSLVRIILTAILAFSVMSSAMAGAVIKRGDSRKSNDDKPSASRQSDSRKSDEDKPSASRQSGSDRSDRSRESRQSDSKRSDRSSDSRRSDAERSDRSHSYKPSEPVRPVAPAVSQERYRKGPDATPAYRRDDDSSRSKDDRGGDYRYRRDNDDSKYYRTDERNRYKYDYPRSYHPPRYDRGNYYYSSPYFYDNRPCRYGYWVFDYIPAFSTRSVYYYYGYFPYIPVTRVIIIRRPAVTVIEVPVVIHQSSYYDDYYLDSPRSGSIERALSDIRSAWLYGEPERLLRHVRNDTRVDVLMDGDYSYSLSDDDYRDMTRDAVSNTRTVEFYFDSVRRRGDDRIVADGRHVFYSRQGDRKTIYITYQLERIGGEWIITEVGSSIRR